MTNIILVNEHHLDASAVASDEAPAFVQTVLAEQAARFLSMWLGDYSEDGGVTFANGPYPGSLMLLWRDSGKLVDELPLMWWRLAKDWRRRCELQLEAI